MQHAVADPGFAKGGADHGELAPKRGSGGTARSVVQGQSPWWGSGSEAPGKLKAFCPFFIQKRGQKLRI